MAEISKKIDPLLLKYWPLLESVDSLLLENIKAAYIHNNNEDAVLITCEGDVYLISANEEGLVKERKCPHLSGKNVIKLCVGFKDKLGYRILVLCDEGSIYGYGSNFLGQLGMEPTGYIPNPKLIEVQKSMDIACGKSHSLILTQDGKVMASGYNTFGQLGIGTYEQRLVFTEVPSNFCGKKISTIHCCNESSYVLTASGEIFCWGNNSLGQLSFGGVDHLCLPCAMNTASFKGLKVMKLVCGNEHVLALTVDGFLFGWGNNAYHQLGFSLTDFEYQPKQMAQKYGKVIDMNAGEDCSCCITEKREVYVWGKLKNGSKTTSNKVSVDSLAEASSLVNGLLISLQPGIHVSKVKKIKSHSLAQLIADGFDDHTTGDIKFLIDGKIIYAHKAILMLTSDHLKIMLNGPWALPGENEIKILEYSYAVYYAFIKYLYTRELDSNIINFQELVLVFDLAKSYLEDQLLKKCEKLIKTRLTIENVSFLYSYATKNLHLDLEEIAFRFALRNKKMFVKSEGFNELEDYLQLNFLKKAAEFE